MRRLHALVLPLALTLGSVALSGCDLFRSRSGDEEAQLRRLQTQIDALVNPATASDAAFCRTIEYGSKPCGGPSRYVIYSAERADTAALGRLARRYTEVESALNRRTGRVSDCLAMGAPRVALEGGVCSVKR